jgi:hypothetical protein
MLTIDPLEPAARTIRRTEIYSERFGEKEPFIRSLRFLLWEALASVARLPALVSHLLLFRRQKCSPILFVYGTLNHWRALRTVVRELEKRFPVLVCGRSSLGRCDVPLYTLGERIVSLVTLPVVLGRTVFALRHLLLRAKGRIYPQIFDEAFMAIPRVLYWMIILAQNPPSIVVVANDHAPTFVAVLRAAKIYGIKSCFVQHSQLSSLPPPVIADIALLDGEIAARALEEQPTSCKLYLTGSPRLSRLGKLSDGEKPRVVGIAVSLRDDAKEVVRVAKQVLGFGVPVVVRPHPRQTEEQLEILHTLRIHKNVEWSEPCEEDTSTYLGRVGVSVAANCGIHLECIMSGRQTFYYPFSPVETYGFYRSGFVSRLDSTKQLLGSLEDMCDAELENLRVRFCASEAPDFPFEPEESMTEIILESMAGGTPSGWHPLGDYKNTVFAYSMT